MVGKVRTRVLVVDDSALMRQLLREILEQAEDLEVVACARDPYDAWQKIRELRPDVLTLDIEMPRMDGLEFLQKLMSVHPTPVVMVSSLTERECDATLKAFELGAVDVVAKPKLDVQAGTMCLAEQIVQKVRTAAQARVRQKREQASQPLGKQKPGLLQSSNRLIAMGASTGGTEAIQEILTQLPADSPGVVIVQHMPEQFTQRFAQRLDRRSRLKVSEAQPGDRVLPGTALIAPGGRHLEVRRKGASIEVHLHDRPPVNHFRPSVDVLFRSIACQVGKHAIGIILTGMGEDGAAGIQEMHQAGAQTIAQNHESCVVFGMPKAAIATGAIDIVCDIGEMVGLLRKKAELV